MKIGRFYDCFDFGTTNRGSPSALPRGQSPGVRTARSIAPHLPIGDLDLTRESGSPQAHRVATQGERRLDRHRRARAIFLPNRRGAPDGHHSRAGVMAQVCSALLRDRRHGVLGGGESCPLSGHQLARSAMGARMDRPSNRRITARSLGYTSRTAGRNAGCHRPGGTIWSSN